jgi:two-component system sensor histidine kinase KdpD
MAEHDQRPDPDELLRRMTVEAARERQGKLKIFFGFAPGVGKTYAMLESARRLRDQGIDVVVGVVETHGRAETAALLEGLEALPPRQVEYRGRRLEEFDLEQAVARHPQVLLLDEAAHTNAPGVRHAKRHQDLLDLLDAGIDVHTTLNVQHVESLNDVVAQVTSVRVRETVPDIILDRADEIELVDLPPEELLLRLREGKVYFPEQAEQARQHFFRRGNLLALRELALRRTADRIDADVQAYREAHSIEQVWAAAERILVCVGPSPTSARLVRAARRMAAGLRAPWVAAYVEPSEVAPMSDADRERLTAHLRLAESLGGEVVRLTGSRVSQALLHYARRHNVTRIIIGKPTHPRIRDLLRGSLLDEVVRGSGDIDVHVISGDAGGSAPSKPDPRARPPIEPAGFAWAAALVGVATGVAYLGRTVVAPADLVMFYLLVIMIVAVAFGRGPSLLASALSVAAYDFFFVPPYFTFAVSDTRHLLTFAMMFAVGVLISGLTLRLRREEQHAREREARTAALYALSRELGTALDEAEAAQVLARHGAELFESGAAVLLASPTGALTETARRGEVPFDAAEQGVARWVLEHGRPAGLGTDTLPGARVTCLPLCSGPNALGVLALAPRTARGLQLENRDLLEAFLRQGSLAIERARLAEEAKLAALLARSEEMRSTLLSTVSHDLRTPLAAITGAATALRDDWSRVPEAERRELLDTVCEEADRLERLVGNLLDMTRVEAGGLRVKREWVPLEELVGAALTRVDPRLTGRPVSTALPADLPLVSVDPVLVQQVLVNLLENAAKYTPPGSALELAAEVAEGMVIVRVADHGPGIAAADRERVFEKFYRGTQAGSGVGLGLAICRGIVEAHGGTIRVESRPGGGALFRIALPVGGEAPALPPEPAAPRSVEEATT